MLELQTVKWDETLKLSNCIGTLVTADADVTRKPAEVNVEARCFE